MNKISAQCLRKKLTKKKINTSNINKNIDKEKTLIGILYMIQT